MAAKIWTTPEWAALAAHKAEVIDKTHLRELMQASAAAARANGTRDQRSAPRFGLTISAGAPQWPTRPWRLTAEAHLCHAYVTQQRLPRRRPAASITPVPAR